MFYYFEPGWGSGAFEPGWMGWEDEPRSGVEPGWIGLEEGPRSGWNQDGRMDQDQFTKQKGIQFS